MSLLILKTLINREQKLLFLMRFLIHTFIILLFSIYESLATNVILVMADDQGWGQTGYYNHPILKNSSPDRMAKNGLRFDRFYAGGPVCSPTRATVLTGRTHDRTGVLDHGYPLRKQEKTLQPCVKKDTPPHILENGI